MYISAIFCATNLFLLKKSLENFYCIVILLASFALNAINSCTNVQKFQFAVNFAIFFIYTFFSTLYRLLWRPFFRAEKILDFLFKPKPPTNQPFLYGNIYLRKIFFHNSFAVSPPLYVTIKQNQTKKKHGRLTTYLKFSVAFN